MRVRHDWPGFSLVSGSVRQNAPGYYVGFARHTGDRPGFQKDLKVFQPAILQEAQLTEQFPGAFRVRRELARRFGPFHVGSRKDQDVPVMIQVWDKRDVGIRLRDAVVDSSVVSWLLSGLGVPVHKIRTLGFLIESKIEVQHLIKQLVPRRRPRAAYKNNV